MKDAPVAAPSVARRIAAPVLALAGVSTAFAYVATVDPNEPGHYPVCPLLALTGLYCPGCGGLRSAHDFITGDLGAALGANALAVIGYLAAAALWVLWTTRSWQGKPFRIDLRPVHWWTLGTVVTVFTVVRNMPFGSVIAP